ncbi:MAG: MlaD family protein [Campylobacterota bacterium]|nr:MlaD family protein [Campylobacterota bacterium]
MEVVKKKKNTILIVWIIPLVALIMASWMVYQKYANDGEKITVIFKSADGFTVNKTQLKYKGVSIGLVTKIIFDRNNLDNVIVEVTVDPAASSTVTREGNQFWKVAPQVSLEGVSGLGTILSGVYIAVMPGALDVKNIEKEREKREFTALDVAPIEKDGGVVTTLNSTQDNLGIGAPILYRNFQIGNIKDKNLEDNEIKYSILINKKYNHLLKEDSKFYMIDGVSLTANLSGIKLNISSLNSLLTGGVELVNSDDNSTKEHKENYKLYNTKDELELSSHSVTLYSNDGFNLIENYSKVYYKGIEAGTVTNIGFNIKDSQTKIDIRLKDKFSFLLKKKPYFWIVEPELSIEGVSGLDALTKGSYISFDINARRVTKNSGAYKLHIEPFIIGTKEIILKAPNTHSLKSGSAIFYKNLPVGSIFYVGLDSAKKDVTIKAVIDEKYTKLINNSTKFYLQSGIDVEASLSGIKIKSAPLQAMLSGGVTFVTPNLKSKDSKKSYKLFKSLEDATQKHFDVSLKLKSASGVKVGSNIVYKGIDIGYVKTIQIRDDALHVELKIEQKYKHFINKNTLFWVRNFSLGLGGIKNGSALLGSKIGIFPGVDAKFHNSFEALDSAPPISYGKKGLRVIVKSNRKSSLEAGAPLYYRQMQIGVLEEYYLSEDSTSINMVLFIDPCYAYLIRKNSIFYNATALGFDVSLTGIKVETETLTSMINGALVVVTPEIPLEEVTNMSSFELVNDADSTWLNWKPKLINKNMLCESIF